MLVKFMGLEAVPFTNRNTGERGVEHRVQVHDGTAVRTVRIPEDKYDQLRRKNLPVMANCEASFEFAQGRFNLHFPALADLEPSKVASAS